MITAGVDVVRLNFSHGEREADRRTFEVVREEARKAETSSLRSSPVPIDQWVSDASVGVDTVESRLIASGAAAPGDDIAITFGRSDIASGPGRTNVLWLWRIR